MSIQGSLQPMIKALQKFKTQVYSLLQSATLHTCHFLDPNLILNLQLDPLLSADSYLTEKVQ